MLREGWYTLRRITGRGGAERSLTQEIEFHVEQLTRKKIAQGLTPEEAARQARLEFGSAVSVREEVRTAWGIAWLDSLWRDLFLALRQLARNPAYTAAAALTLALGLGANIAVFTVIHHLLLRPLPYRDGDRLLILRNFDQRQNRPSLRYSVQELQEFRAQAASAAELAEHHVMNFTLLGNGEPETVPTGIVSANFFEFLGVKALYGRTFLPGEDQPGADPVIVLSYRYFQSSFGGDPKVVGRKLRMNDRVHTVAGVLPPLPDYPAKVDVYMPISSCQSRSSPDLQANRRARLMDVFVRLKPGADRNLAQAEFAAISRRQRDANPGVYPAHEQWGTASTPLLDELSSAARPTFLMLFAATGLVLLIACANVANLTISRSLKREREIAIRSALGATRGRLLQQFFVEGLLISLAGTAVGALAAYATMGLLTQFAARFSPRAYQIGMDSTVVLFAFGAAVLSAIFACALPAWRTPADLTASTREGSAAATPGRARSRTRGALVCAQVGLSAMLLVGAGLLLRSFVNLIQVEAGFETDRVLSMTVSPNWSHLRDNETYRKFFETMLDRIRQLPGVVSAGLGAKVPMNQTLPTSRNFLIEGQTLNPESQPLLDLSIASPGFFPALGVKIISGREFQASDAPDAARVAIVNQRLAARYWPGKDPIGRRVSLNNGRDWITIVGVVGDVRSYGLNREATEELYVPFSQNPGGTFVIVRTAGDPHAMDRALRRVVHDLNPEQAVSAVRTLEELRSENLAAPKLTTSLLVLLAALTLLVTVTGIAGVAALSAGQRKKEIGIRIALGATPLQVIAAVVRGELRMVLLGLALGLAGAVVFSRFLASFLFQTAPTDSLTLAGCVALLLGVSIAACVIPARRAATADPLQSLRGD